MASGVKKHLEDLIETSLPYGLNSSVLTVLATSGTVSGV